MTVGCLAGPRRTIRAQLAGMSPLIVKRTLLETADLMIDLLLKNYANTLCKWICFQTLHMMKPNTTMNSNEDSR
jgi:hypothetical protein